MTERAKPKTRAEFKHFLEIPTRWSDNDQFGHVNNPVYNMWFDTLVNNWMISSFQHNHLKADFLALVVETQCSFFSDLSYPEVVDCGLVCTKIGRSSITFEIGIFRKGVNNTSALGRFVQVVVNRDNKKPVSELPENFKNALVAISA